MKRLIIILMVLIVLVPLVGCGSSEREAMITFTRQALEIEGKRNELVNFYVPLPKKAWIGRLTSGTNPFISKTFLAGVPPNAYGDAPSTGLEGMTSLRQRLLLLNCPQVLQPVKDSLLSIYSSEMIFTEKTTTDSMFSPRERETTLQTYKVGGPLYATDGLGQYVAISINNLDYWTQRQIVNSDWYKAQSFRRDVYIQWAQLLKKHTIDPIREGFTDLTKVEKRGANKTASP